MRDRDGDRGTSESFLSKERKAPPNQVRQELIEKALMAKGGRWDAAVNACVEKWECQHIKTTQFFVKDRPGDEEIRVDLHPATYLKPEFYDAKGSQEF
ncbi:hypothetical protein OIU85_004886 [Salix viminalis]|uniref:Uncharacterized protein n=1 Tax=Salix viminalis TaxID=40686 RepID=A0A9Q0SXW2_SALVM|nr:hypothetical protein OIU85_004886 [Salix viminalis]